MKRSLMVFAAISAFALPALAPVATLAQSRGERGEDDRARSPQRDDARAARREQLRDSGDRPAQSRPSRDDGPRRDRGGSRPDRPQAPPPSTPATQPDRSGGDNNGGRRDRGDRPGRGGNDNSGWNGAGQNRPGQDRPGPDRARPGRPGQDRPDRPGNGRWNGSGRPGENRPDDNRPGNNGGWNGNGPNRPGNEWNNGGDRSRDRDRQRNEYRNRFDSSRWQQNWNRNHRADWWRNDRRFNGWSGARIGFYFAPGYGYYSVPRSYYGRQYQEGDYLPSVFWRYSVNDYRTYGLGYPPEGTRWVYVDNAIYLIDAYDGYIIDVIRNAWRW